MASTACLLKESFDRLWRYSREGWARRFSDDGKDSLKWQRLKPFETFAAMVERNLNVLTCMLPEI